MITRTDLRREVRYWQRKLEPLGLRHWRIKVLIVDEPDGKATSDACVNTSQFYDTAQIEFRREFLDYVTNPDLDRTIVHELLHIVFRDHDHVISMITQELGATAKELIDHQLNHEAEGIVERLARAIVALHPR